MYRRIYIFRTVQRISIDLIENHDKPSKVFSKINKISKQTIIENPPLSKYNSD